MRKSTRWYQFRLRTLLIGFVAVAVPCSWVAAAYRQHRVEQRVLSEISQVPGFITVIDKDTHVFCGTGITGVFRTESTAPGWLAGSSHLPHALGMFDRVTEVELVGHQYDDSVVQHLTKLRCLRFVTLWDTSISDTGVIALRRRLPTCTIERIDEEDDQDES
jgi:hypothetical protein